MDSKYDVSDSTDWLHTPLSSFSTLEAALRCQVCKDFFSTPMITSCSHTFCSLCIRRCLASDGKCPACRAGDDASRLRRNWTVQEVVETFAGARPAALELARKDKEREDEGVKWRRKRKIEDTDIEDEEHGAMSSQRRTRSQAKRIEQSSQKEIMKVEESIDDEYQPEEEQQQPDDGLVPCPLCSKRMKEEAVFPHLDHCENEQKQERQTRTSRSKPANPLPPQPPPTRLPQLNYSILKEIALRKKLRDLGISTQGPRQLLIRRHTEWINLYNANCDASQPRSKAELLRELDVWERSQGGFAREAVTTVMRKDFDASGWAQSNSDQFQSLIQAARAKRVGMQVGGGQVKEEEGEETNEERKEEEMREEEREENGITQSVDVLDSGVQAQEVSGPPPISHEDNRPQDSNPHSERMTDIPALPNTSSILTSPPSSPHPPTRLSLSPTKKLPMFIVPGESQESDRVQTAQ